MGLSEIDILKLLSLNGIGPVGASKVIKILDEYNAYDDSAIIKAFTKLSKTLNSPFSFSDLEEAKKTAEQIVESTLANNIGILTYHNPNFPIKLRKLKNPPLILYYLGDISRLNENSIAIIGTRKPTDYGIKLAQRTSKIICQSKTNIISGLAIGCDSISHETAIDNKIYTSAILPCGLDKIYPKENEQLAKDIIKSGGSLISEYPVGTKPFKGSFVQRDRLVSGITNGTIVIQCDKDSGTIHTSKFALKQERQLGVLKIENKSGFEGNNFLINEFKKTSSISDKASIDKFIKKSTLNQKLF